MMIDKIRSDIKKVIGQKKRFKFYGARNQNEEFIGTVSAIYPVIFTVIVENSGLRSFSYSDILTGNLDIVDI